MKKQPRAWVMILLVAVFWGLFFSSVRLTADKLSCDYPSREASESGLLREIRIGIFAHDVDHLWSKMHLEEGIDFNAEILFSRPCIRALSGILFPNLGITINDSGNTSKCYAGFLWEWTTRWGIFLDLGLGVAIHNGELNTPVPGRKLLGCRVLFRIPFELGYRISSRFRISLMFSHVSNGYTTEYNQGLYVLGVRLGYWF